MRQGMTDIELIAALKRKPYDRACREAARRLEELLADREAKQATRQQKR